MTVDEAIHKLQQLVNGGFGDWELQMLFHTVEKDFSIIPVEQIKIVDDHACVIALGVRI